MKKKLSIFVILLVLYAAVAGSVTVATTGCAIEAETVSPVTVADKYVKGETLTVPEAKLDCGGMEADAIGVVTAPSGKAVASDEIVLDEAGMYTLTYRAYHNNRLYTHVKTFRVTEKLFEVSGSGSAAYGTHAYRDDLYGIVTSLGQGDVFSINQAIDLRGLTRVDNVLSLFFTPETVGVPDAGALVVTFTDAYDAENVVTVKCKNVYRSDAEWTLYWSYAAAGAVGQPSVGIEKLERDGTVQVIYNGEIYILHSNDDYGTTMRLSMSGTPESGGVGDQTFRLAWELDEKQIFCTSYSDTNHLLTDLDEPIFYKANLWDGFTTGEVFIDVKGENYNADTLNFVINGIADLDLERTEHVDTVAPELNVDCGENIPFARVGSPYRIFEAHATDLYDVGVVVNRTVYFNYAGNKSIVDIKDGCFTPNREGIYTVVYTATDKSGNTATETVDVKARSDCALQATVKNAESALSSCVEIPKPTVTNASGTAEITVRAKIGNEEYAVEDFAFLPKRTGEYTLVYKIADYVSSVELEAKLTVGRGSEISFASRPDLPAYFITGKQYDLPVPDAYNYTGEIVAPGAVEVSVREDGGAATKVDGTYTARAKTETEITYTVAGTDVSETYTVPTVDVKADGVLKMERYFVGPYSAESGEENIVFTPEGEGELEFINLLQVYKFNASFSLPTFSAHALNVYLRSGEDTVKIGYVAESGTTVLYLNDKKTSISLGNALQKGTTVMLTYQADGKILSPIDGAEIIVNETLEGKRFEGFHNDRAYLSFEIEGQRGSTALALAEINGQTFTLLPRDRVAPQVLGSVIRGSIALGSEVVIRPAVIADVLDPNVEIAMSVIAPDGKPAVTVDGVSLQNCSVDETYVIRADQYGSYLIRYYAADTSGQKAQPTYGFTVTDTMPPEIELSKHDQTAKQGATVQLASATATDNVDGNVTVHVTVKTPSGTVYYMKDNNRLQCTEKGKYTVSYIAYDAAGNVAYSSYTITVQ